MATVKFPKALLLFSALACATAPAVFAADHPLPGTGIGARYATDAYPGFDDDDFLVKPERKEPRWFAWLNGPSKADAASQLAYCRELIASGNHSRAQSQLDALVREWPTAAESPVAQLLLAEISCDPLKDYETAFDAYRYLLDFYSLHCDYRKIADRLYEIAGQLQREGKEVMFVRFANTVDVRRAYEACILRAPGAKWVPQAMLTVGSLRESESRLADAVKVYENLRNLYPDSDEAKTAVVREAGVRMRLLADCGYNRLRCSDTIGFLQLALRNCRPEDAPAIEGMLATARAHGEHAAYLGAKFYDSPTRTKRSAVSAYERFLADYPNSGHADEVRRRLEELKEAGK